MDWASEKAAAFQVRSPPVLEYTRVGLFAQEGVGPNDPEQSRSRVEFSAVLVRIGCHAAASGAKPGLDKRCDLLVMDSFVAAAAAAAAALLALKRPDDSPCMFLVELAVEAETAARRLWVVAAEAVAKHGRT